MVHPGDFPACFKGSSWTRSALARFSPWSCTNAPTVQADAVDWVTGCGGAAEVPGGTPKAVLHGPIWSDHTVLGTKSPKV